LLDDVLRRTNDHRRNPIKLKVAGDQTHGLVADRSERHQQRNIYTVSSAEVEHCGGILIARPPLTEICEHSIKARR
jgi:hypothetical protein